MPARGFCCHKGMVYPVIGALRQKWQMPGVFRGRTYNEGRTKGAGAGERGRVNLMIQGAFDAFAAAVKDVGVDHGGFYIFVSQ